ncbi:MAG: hybrid sensor histidine kinase/response regulator, partial [Aggregatilineales bacterium]
EIAEDIRKIDKEIPIIFLTAKSNPEDKVKGFKSGGDDYITKPFHLEEVQARVETHLKLQRQKHEIERLREEDRRYFEEITQIREELVQSITHELKSPLAVIYSYAGMIQRYPEIQENEKLANSINAIKRSTMNLSEMISNILEAAKIEAGIDVLYHRVLLNELVDFQVANFQSIASQKNITFIFHDRETKIRISADERLMGMAISNLLSNAIKYTPDNGSIDVRLTTADEQIVTLSIKDTGIGIPVDDLQNIFKRFHRVPHEAHLAIEGTGLGLSIVESIIQQHQGEIRVDSILDEGTTFHIILPFI